LIHGVERQEGVERHHSYQDQHHAADDDDRRRPDRDLPDIHCRRLKVRRSNRVRLTCGAAAATPSNVPVGRPRRQVQSPVRQPLWCFGWLMSEHVHRPAQGVSPSGGTPALALATRSRSSAGLGRLDGCERTPLSRTIADPRTGPSRPCCSRTCETSSSARSSPASTLPAWVAERVSGNPKAARYSSEGS